MRKLIAVLGAIAAIGLAPAAFTPADAQSVVIRAGHGHGHGYHHRNRGKRVVIIRRDRGHHYGHWRGHRHEMHRGHRGRSVGVVIR